MTNQPNNKLITAALIAIIALPLVYLVKQRLDISQSSNIAPPQASSVGVPKSKDNADSFQKFIDLGLAYYKAKDFKKAVEFTQKAIAINPQNAAAYNNLCSAYNELQMWEEAIKACNKALEVDPELSIAKNNLNWAKQGQNQ